MEGIFQSMNYHSNALPAHQILITCFARNALSMKLIKVSNHEKSNIFKDHKCIMRHNIGGCCDCGDEKTIQ